MLLRSNPEDGIRMRMTSSVPSPSQRRMGFGGGIWLLGLVVISVMTGLVRSHT